MLNDEPLTPSEAMIDTSLDALLFPEYDAFTHFQWIVCAWANSFGESKPRSLPRPRNSRVRMVQARRKGMGLSQDGKCCGLRSRKASYSFRMAEQRYYDYYLTPGIIPPRARDFEHVPARRRKRDAQWQLRWKPLAYSDQERAWIDSRDANTREICTAFALSEPVAGKLSTLIVDNFDAFVVPDTQESESSNG